MNSKKFELKSQFFVESARFLPKLPPTHPCSKMHGHSFKIICSFVGQQNEIGWVIDYHTIDKEVRAMLNQIDHKTLNDIIESPTSENLTLWLYEQIKAKLPELKQVSVSETHNTECLYPAF